MDSTARRSGGDLLEGFYRVFMRCNSVYVTFVVLSAFAGERAVDYGVHKLWEYNNVGLSIVDFPLIDDEPNPDGVIQEQGIRMMDAFKQSIAEAILHACNSECP